MSEHDNRRRYHRIDYDTPVLLQQGKREWPSLVIDISLHGLLVARPDDWSADTNQAINATIPLGGDALIQMRLQQIHSRENSVGFFCERIEESSIPHLRRLLEMSLGDPQLVERELSELG